MGFSSPCRNLAAACPCFNSPLRAQWRPRVASFPHAKELGGTECLLLIGREVPASRALKAAQCLATQPDGQPFRCPFTVWRKGRHETVTRRVKQDDTGTQQEARLLSGRSQNWWGLTARSSDWVRTSDPAVDQPPRPSLQNPLGTPVPSSSSS